MQGFIYDKYNGPASVKFAPDVMMIDEHLIPAADHASRDRYINMEVKGSPPVFVYPS
jgi:hypothetical protein